MISPHVAMTAEQLAQSTQLGRCELVEGRLVMMSPFGFRHGKVAANVARLLGGFVKQYGLGVVTGADLLASRLWPALEVRASELFE